MKAKRLISAALAAAMALGSTAFAADEQPAKTERIVTTQNGTGYTVSSVGRHVIPVDDGSRSFAFAPTEGYDLSQLIITDGEFSDRADVTSLDKDLTMNGVSYPIRYESKIDAQGTSVIRATVSIPAAQDDITLSAEAASAEYTVTATSQSGATVSAGTVKLAKGDTYSMTAKPDGNLYAIARADVTVGQNRTSVDLSKGCDEFSQGFRFTMDAEGVLTVYCGGVTSSAMIELKTAERQPDSDEVLIKVNTGRGIDSEISKDIVQKGSDYTVSFTADRGYAIDALILEADEKTAYSTPNTNTVFVGTNAYRVSGNDSGCTVYLTDLQSDITVSAESSYDSDHLLVETSAGTGVRIDKDCGSGVDVGSDVEFEIYVSDEDRYELDRITLRVGDSSKTVDSDETSIRVGGETYRMSTDLDGVLHLYVTDIDKPVRVSATANRIDSTQRITMKNSSHLTLRKDVSGSTVKTGDDVRFSIEPDNGYTVDTVTLKVGSKSATANASASAITVDGVSYDMERGADGTVYVYVDNIRADITISADAERGAVSTGSGSNGKIRMDRSVKSPFLVGYNSYFFPEDPMTRADAVQMLARMSNAGISDYPANGFTDVRADAYYAEALDAFAYGGIVDRNTPYFHPDTAITRADFAVMIYRLDTTSGYRGASRFYDVPQSAVYAEAISYCADRGWVNGYPDGSFRPNGLITRAEAAAVVNRAMGRTLASSNLSGIRYTDVPQSHWAYQDILIASSYQW